MNRWGWEGSLWNLTGRMCWSFVLSASRLYLILSRLKIFALITFYVHLINNKRNKWKRKNCVPGKERRERGTMGSRGDVSSGTNSISLERSGFDFRPFLASFIIHILPSTKHNQKRKNCVVKFFIHWQSRTLNDSTEREKKFFLCCIRTLTQTLHRVEQIPHEVMVIRRGF